MQPRKNAGVPLHGQVIDGATLYLCRQGQRWVVVLESPHVPERCRSTTQAGGHEARFELLALSRLACPDATVISTDGALTTEDYEWQVEVRGVAQRLGDLGIALHRDSLPGPRTRDGAAASGDRATLPLGYQPIVLRPSPPF